MATVIQDLKDAVRSLTRGGASTLIIVATLALAMGTGGAVFMVAGALLRRTHVVQVGLQPGIGLLPPGAALVVWIACANVTNVVLTRGMNRRRDLAIRAAIGSSRLHIVRQLLVEDVVLSVAGGAIGLLLCLTSSFGL